MNECQIILIEDIWYYAIKSWNQLFNCRVRWDKQIPFLWFVGDYKHSGQHIHQPKSLQKVHKKC